MKTTHAAIVRGLAKHADVNHIIKTASDKTAAASRKRWLEDQDLMKLCRLCKQKQKR